MLSPEAEWAILKPCALCPPLGCERAQLAALALDITVAHSSYRQNSIPGNKILIQLSVLVAARVSRDACPCPISRGPTDAGRGRWSAPWPRCHRRFAGLA